MIKLIGIKGILDSISIFFSVLVGLYNRDRIVFTIILLWCSILILAFSLFVLRVVESFEENYAKEVMQDFFVRNFMFTVIEDRLLPGHLNKELSSYPAGTGIQIVAVTVTYQILLCPMCGIYLATNLESLDTAGWILTFLEYTMLFLLISPIADLIMMIKIRRFHYENYRSGLLRDGRDEEDDFFE